MYDEYPTVYKSNINEYLAIWIALGVIALILVIFTLIALSRVFKKANISPIRAYIPILNLISLLEISNMSKAYVLLLLIPGVNIPFWIMLNMKLAKLFKKEKMFGIGMSFLPFIYYPILAFSGSEYIGINLVAMEAKNELDKIPVIETDIKEEIQKEENTQIDTGSRGINISIGGGVYQKNYTKTLLNVDENKKLVDDFKDVKEENKNQNNVFLTEMSNNIAETAQQPMNINNSVQSTNNTIPQQKNNADIFSVNFIKTEQPQTNNTNNNFINNNQNNVNNNTINDNVQAQAVNNNLNSNFINNPINTEENNQNNNISSITGQTTNSNQPKPEPVNFVKKMESIEYKLCPNCGTRLQDGSKVCFICGQKIE